MQPLTIGRKPDNHVVVALPHISGHHARYTPITANTGILEDLDSINGTEVDGVRIYRAVINAGSQIVLGRKTPLDVGTLFAAVASPAPAPTPKLPTMQPITIGRKQDNHVVVALPHISGYHARFTLITANRGLLEDLDSTNGTEVDGLRIYRAVINAGSQVVLGRKTPLDVATLFVPVAQPAPAPKPAAAPVPKAAPAAQPNKPPGAAKEIDVSEAFAQLEASYKAYKETKAALERQDKVRQALLQAGCALIPYVGMAISRLLALKFLSEKEKIDALEQEMRINFLCPNCAKILHPHPYEVLVKQKKCLQCRAIWVR